jgi:DeoR/GlpR family transcriptional regulator of sugar metabolism
LRVADFLRENESKQTFLVGGQIKKSGNITDALANEFISQFTFDQSFLVGGGLSLSGLSTLTPEVATLHRMVADHSRKKICLATHHKFGFDSFVNIVPLNKLDLIITDEETPKDKIEQMESNGIQVVVANINKELGGHR